MTEYHEQCCVWRCGRDATTDRLEDPCGGGNLRWMFYCDRHAPNGWPWDGDWWKPTRDDPIRQLTKVGALIAAAIDRLRNEPATK